MTVFAVSDLWHGASWTLLTWGVLHGAALLVERGTRWAADKARLPGMIQGCLGVVLTSALVLVAWVFFRSPSFADAWTILRSWTDPGPLQYGTFKVLGLASFELLLTALHLAALLMIDAAIRFRPTLPAAIAEIPAAGTCIALLLFFDIALFGVFGHLDFICFQF